MTKRRIFIGMGACLLLFILLVVFVSPSNIKSAEVLSIRLECVDSCKDTKQTQASFTEKTFDDKNEIRTFVKAINRAKKLKGELDYGVYFYMYLSFKDGHQKKYVLNIGNSEKKGTRGLLVDTGNSGQGYSISEREHEKLRKLIFQ